jgi:MraZ protein
MFTGTYTPKLDQKGRLFLPAKFRDDLEEGLMITRGQERCLAVYPLDKFEQQAERLNQASFTNPAIRGYARVFGSGAFRETPDKQGRITIAPLLREYASLTKDVVVIGSIHMIEIWDPEAWQRYLGEQESVYANLDQEVFPGV